MSWRFSSGQHRPSSAVRNRRGVGGIPIDGNAGGRYVKTEPTLKGFRTAQACGFDAISIEPSYYNWLPSVNLRAQLRDEVFLRAGASKVVTRPSFDQLTPGHDARCLHQLSVESQDVRGSDVRSLKWRSGFDIAKPDSMVKALR
jgi:iron complex outermembrane recepter protein